MDETMTVEEWLAWTPPDGQAGYVREGGKLRLLADITIMDREVVAHFPGRPPRRLGPADPVVIRHRRGAGRPAIVGRVRPLDELRTALHQALSPRPTAAPLRQLVADALATLEAPQSIDGALDALEAAIAAARDTGVSYATAVELHRRADWLAVEIEETLLIVAPDYPDEDGEDIAS